MLASEGKELQEKSFTGAQDRHAINSKIEQHEKCKEEVREQQKIQDPNHIYLVLRVQKKINIFILEALEEKKDISSQLVHLLQNQKHRNIL